MTAEVAEEAAERREAPLDGAGVLAAFHVLHLPGTHLTGTDIVEDFDVLAPQPGVEVLEVVNVVAHGARRQAALGGDIGAEAFYGLGEGHVY